MEEELSFNWFWNCIEIVLLLVIIYFQVKICITTWKKTLLLKGFLPDKSNVSITRIPVEETGGKLTSVLSIGKKGNSLLTEVSKSINGYLKKNKGNAADFHLLKNIVDRHIDTLDEEIGHLLPVPLYLGLAGTMIGIITGLMCINGNVDSDAFVHSISTVVDNIKYAMICSLLGLVMTTVLSAFFYRKAKADLEKQKNTFLDLLQTELLPHLNEDASATLLNMQSNLKLFNDQFRENITGFKGIMNDVHEAFDSQVELVKRLKQMDLVQMSTLNMKVLDKLHASTSEFEKFTRYLNNMNIFINSTTRLTSSINEQLDKTDMVRTVAAGVKENIERNQQVMEMLQDFLTKVNANSALLHASQMVDSAVAAAMEDMKKHVEVEVDNIKTYTNKATEDLDALMQKERGQLDKLKHLEKIDTLAKAVQQLANDSHTINTSLAKRIAELSDSIRNGGGNGNGSAGLPRWLVMTCVIVVIVTCIVFLWTAVSYNNIAKESETQNVQNTITVDSTSYRNNNIQ